MTRRTVYSIVCLSGHGIASEVMAQASRALASVSRLHGFRVRETHPPFGSGALTHRATHCRRPHGRRRSAHRRSSLRASDPALAGVESELDLRARMDRVAFDGRGAITLFSPLLDSTLEWTLARAFDVARSSRARIAVRRRRCCVGSRSRVKRRGTTACSWRSSPSKPPCTTSRSSPSGSTSSSRRLPMPRRWSASSHTDVSARRSVQPARRQRAERVRSGSRGGRGHRRPGSRQPGLDAARGGAMLGEGLGERAGGARR